MFDPHRAQVSAWIYQIARNRQIDILRRERRPMPEELHEEPGSEAEAVLGRAHEAAMGRPLQSFMTPAYLDARVHALYDKIPALCYGPMGENIHAFDERVSLASVKRITGSMALFVAEWCGVEPVSG